MVQNKNPWAVRLKAKFKASNTFAIGVTMLIYWGLINLTLFSLINVVSSPWTIISGFNLGFLGSFIGLLILGFASKWLFSKAILKQMLAYVTFLIRMTVYGLIIGLAIYFSCFNLFSIIGGFSLLILGTLTSEMLVFSKGKRAKEKC